MYCCSCSTPSAMVSIPSVFTIEIMLSVITLVAESDSTVSIKDLSIFRVSMGSFFK